MPQLDEPSLAPLGGGPWPCPSSALAHCVAIHCPVSLHSIWGIGTGLVLSCEAAPCVGRDFVSLVLLAIFWEARKALTLF